MLQMEAKKMIRKTCNLPETFFIKKSFKCFYKIKYKIMTRK